MITVATTFLEVRMTDPSSKRGAKRRSGMSTWVKVTLIALVVALVVVVVIAVSSGSIGGHQIPEHAPAADAVVSAQDL
jgi:hypothetical protein